ncbi:MAG: hypothetical protein M5U26_29860 [Planctomycetota bacterium]|nr:hypothetical protein [Planctomycetota bacterium]
MVGEVMTAIQIRISDDLARKAKAEGLLAPGTIEQLLREALRKKAANKLLRMSRALQVSNPGRGLTEDEVRILVEKEVGTVRSFPKGKRARRS